MHVCIHGYIYVRIFIDVFIYVRIIHAYVYIYIRYIQITFSEDMNTETVQLIQNMMDPDPYFRFHIDDFIDNEYIYIRACVYVYMRVCICIYARVHMYIFMYV